MSRRGVDARKVCRWNWVAYSPLSGPRRNNAMKIEIFVTLMYIENKAFSEEGLFGCELSCGTSCIVRHCYGVVGSILRIYCLPLSDNWRASWRMIGRTITLRLLLLPNKPSSENALFSIPLPGVRIFKIRLRTFATTLYFIWL